MQSLPPNPNISLQKHILALSYVRMMRDNFSLAAVLPAPATVSETVIFDASMQAFFEFAILLSLHDSGADINCKKGWRERSEYLCDILEERIKYD